MLSKLQRQCAAKMSGLPINNVVPYPSTMPSVPPLNNFTTPAIDILKCSYANFDYNIVVGIMCGMYLVFGVVYSLFGESLIYEYEYLLGIYRAIIKCS